MPNVPGLSPEFWVATIVAVVLAILTLLLGLGATLAMDAKTKGEFRFAAGCFIFSALMIVGTIGLWDVTTQATMARRILISACLFAVVGVLLVETIRWTHGRHIRARESEQPAENIKHRDEKSKVDTTNPVGSLAQLGWGIKDAKDATTFEISNRELPDMKESAKYFRALRKPFYLHFQQVPSITGLHSLAGIRTCVRVEIGASNIDDISELKGMTSVRQLVIGQTPFTEIKELKIDAVSSLSDLDTLVLNMSRVTSLEPARHLKRLVTLNIGGSLVDDLSPISGLRSLKSVDVRDSRVADLSPLRGASRLDELNIDAKQASSLDRVPQIKKLVIIAQVPVDLTKIAALSHLTSLSIWGPPVVDFAPLRSLSLTDLQVSGMLMNRLSDVRDIDAIGTLKYLSKLTLGWLQVSSLRFLNGNSTLREINLSAMPIESAPELGSLTSLRSLSLVDIPIVDISPLLLLPKFEALRLLRTPARADVISALEKSGVRVTNN